MYDDEKVPGQHEYRGKYKGFVRDNVDPENRGRVRVFCPQVMGPNDDADHWLGWAEPCFPWMGGLNTGDFGPPFTRDEQLAEAGTEYFGVWVEFEDGHVDFPIWVGTFTVAPLPTSESAHTQGSTGGTEGMVGGTIIGRSGLPTGSEDAALNPPTPLAEREVRLLAKKGRDVLIGVDGGGTILLGPSGAHVVAPQLTLNGQPFFTSITKLGA